MRLRALEYIACPQCHGTVRVHPLQTEELPVKASAAALADEIGIDKSTIAVDVSEGFILCDACRTMYPLHESVPRLFVYTLAASADFLTKYKKQVEDLKAQGWRLPNGQPEPGEKTVQRSFSKQWGDYDYDGIIWSWTNEGRLELALREIGIPQAELRGRSLADVGCGNAVLSNMFATKVGMEVTGMDLSFAAVQAARQFRAEPLLNFVQGSVFRLPLRQGAFDVGYSSGVLHHTYNTHKAVSQAAKLVKPNGTFYFWAYSSERYGVQGAISRSANAVRAVVSRLPSPIQDALLYTVLTPMYWAGRAVLRPILLDKNTTQYNWTQAVHAARDAFTPLYAHHHSASEVAQWFRELGYAEVEQLAPYNPAKSKTIPCSVRARRPRQASNTDNRQLTAAG
jgi:SAM-dependent methyltransferase/uncharacterized protein YbaR (Trm112 family)